MSRTVPIWTELSRPQTEFFESQLEAASQLAFSETAHAGGIVPINANRFSAGLPNQQSAEVIAWPNPYRQNSACVLYASRAAPKSLQAFIVASSTKTGVDVKGVTTGINDNSGSAIYGNYSIGIPQEKRTASFIPASHEFLAAAIRRSNPALPANMRKKPAEVHQVGVEGSTISGLYAMLASFGGNLAVNNGGAEAMWMTGETYDLAQMLYRAAFRGINSSNLGKGLVIPNQHGGIGISLFESDNHGFVAVQQVEGFPSTTAVTFLPRPRLDDSLLIAERYSIRSGRTSRDMLMVDAEQYGQQGLLQAIAVFSTETRNSRPGQNTQAGAAGEMDPLDVQTLNKKMLSIVTEITEARSENS